MDAVLTGVFTVPLHLTVEIRDSGGQARDRPLSRHPTRLLHPHASAQALHRAPSDGALSVNSASGRLAAIDSGRMDLFVSGDTNSLSSPCFPNSAHFRSHTKSSVTATIPTSATIAKCPSASPSMMCQILKRSRSRRVAMDGGSQALRTPASLRSPRSLGFCRVIFPPFRARFPRMASTMAALTSSSDKQAQIYYCNGWTCFCRTPPLNSADLSASRMSGGRCRAIRCHGSTSRPAPRCRNF